MIDRIVLFPTFWSSSLHCRPRNCPCVASAARRLLRGIHASKLARDLAGSVWGESVLHPFLEEKALPIVMNMAEETVASSRCQLEAMETRLVEKEDRLVEKEDALVDMEEHLLHKEDR